MFDTKNMVGICYKKGEPDNGMIETYFNFDRYLPNYCSRQGDPAASLQGIWPDGNVTGLKARGEPSRKESYLLLN